MKSQQAIAGLLSVVRNVYLDACDECSVNPDSRDLDYIKARVEDEGLSFLTITLPSFCRDFERSLAEGRIDSKRFREYRKCRAIPAFLQGMLSLVFNRQTGVLDDSPREYPRDTAVVVRSIRQICRCLTKLQAACLPSRENEALQGFSSIEQALSSSTIQAVDLHDFDRVSRLLWDNMLGSFTPERVRPAHGPGTTADGTTGNRKYDWKVWHERLEPYFPFLGFCLPLGAADSKEFENVRFVQPEQELPSRVILVPKTMKAPRTIAAEPLPAQYAQQAVRSFLYRVIETSEPTRGHVNFTDQNVNQTLALASSKDGSMATLDLSDASDRVALGLVHHMLSGCPELLETVLACRTTRAKLPNGTIVGPLEKFASMGSALCFPIESMVFYTICVATLLRKYKLPFDRPSILRVGRLVYVYGDDIIVPVDVAEAVCDSLHRYLCKVNVHKSFWTGKFRESCGTDAYDGIQVTPVYVRQFIPTNRRQHTEIISACAAANQFASRGYLRTSELLYKRIERILGKLPYVREDSPAVGRIIVDDLPFSDIVRLNKAHFNRRTQRVEVRAWVVEPVYRTDRLVGYAALGKSLLMLESSDNLDSQLASLAVHGGTRGRRRASLREIDSVLNQSWFLGKIKLGRARDKHHLERSARHGVATLKRRAVAIT
ncbi:TPA_asm: RNA-directed RNA polymerase [ssRNA phage Gephyllon.4_2]|uniref:RNA-directed RNA polymerase n=2 Tax=Leviviricetes TaxID=2842243 RepID=A0A8S5KXR9_9VIRU|nr:RNA-directed RNA polymerase [ssRNA phage Gephyllon.4_2]QDH90179.1 MAG: RNA-dependent RNA polymerase [Leviviridae sp.]DAD50177.1 TPA_asm: RNA-directed RNA polymerase [ssRNA phage Gephyllon.4_2]